MESGLEDRNNCGIPGKLQPGDLVSMESGLEDRNNGDIHTTTARAVTGLNGVRPRRPEQ